MKLVDINVLVASQIEVHAQHQASRRWLRDAMRAHEAVALPWIVTVGFVRIVTSPRIVAEPMTVVEARVAVESWLSRPQVTCPEPGPDHLARVCDLLDGAGGAGNLVNDAHLAALAMEHRATVVSYDTDFGKFAGLKWRTPDQLLNEAGS